MAKHEFVGLGPRAVFVLDIFISSVGLNSTSSTFWDYGQQ